MPSSSISLPHRQLLGRERLKCPMERLLVFGMSCNLSRSWLSSICYVMKFPHITAASESQSQTLSTHFVRPRHNISCNSTTDLDKSDHCLIPFNGTRRRRKVLTVPYCVPLLIISLALCILLALHFVAVATVASNPTGDTSPCGDSLNWAGNTFFNTFLKRNSILHAYSHCHWCSSLNSLLCLLTHLTPLIMSRLKWIHPEFASILTVSNFLLLTTLVTDRYAVSAHSKALLDSMNSYEHEEENDNDQSAYPTIRALVNGSVGLPCNISQTKEENSIKLILWYKSTLLGLPIYSIDAREVNISQARHFVAPAFRKRASFELQLNARLAILMLQPLNEDDDAHYICRVDYRWTRTTVSTVKLDVIVPPQQLQLHQLSNTVGWLQWPSMSFSTTNRVVGKNDSAIYSVNPSVDVSPGGETSSSSSNHPQQNGSLHRHQVSWSPPPYQSHPLHTLSILHNGLMINEIQTVRQPEETELNLVCDSIGGRPTPMVKWYRLTQLESLLARNDVSSEQFYTQLQSIEESELQLIDDSFREVNRTKLSTINNSFGLEPDISNTLTQSQSSAHKLNQTKPTSAAMPAAVIENQTNNSLQSALVRNELHLGIVREANHGELYLCRTSNSNLSKPMDLIVQLEIYTGPKSIQIRQQLPSKNFLPPPFVNISPSSSSSSPWWPTEPSKGDVDSVLSEKVQGLVRNRTLHSIELLDYYLNSNQPLMTHMPLRMRSGYKSEFLCHTNGSRPAAQIRWFLKDFHTAVEKDISSLSSSFYNGGDTFSWLSFVPKFTDNKASLICRACNRVLQKKAIVMAATTAASTRDRNFDNHGTISSHQKEPYAFANGEVNSMLEATKQRWRFALETIVLLEVNYKPIVSIQILSGEQMYHEVSQSTVRQDVQQPSEISQPSKSSMPVSVSSNSESETKMVVAANTESTALSSNPTKHQFVETQEIFFNCSINSNPTAHLVQWFANGKLLQTDLAKGMIVTNSNRTLIISSVSKEFARFFHCCATNLLGQTCSERHQIEVLYEPQCQVDFAQNSYHRLGDKVELKCQVWANPAENLKFTWNFNGTALVGEKSHSLYMVNSNYSAPIDHTVPIGTNEEESQTDDTEVHGRSEHSKLSETNAGLANRQWWQSIPSSNEPPQPHQQPYRSSTHSSSQQQHLVTNVVQIELNKWASFGHFSCQARNRVGLQKEACKWHIMPHHHHTRHQDGLNRDTDPSQQQRHRSHQYHRHHQQQQQQQHSGGGGSGSGGQQEPHHLVTTGGDSLLGKLNNCQIIESSNAVVIKCLDDEIESSDNAITQDFLAQTTDHGAEQEQAATIDRIVSFDSAVTVDLNREIPTRLTYHVQVYRLTSEAFNNRINSSLRPTSATKWNSELETANDFVETMQYTPQTNRDQLEPGKRVASTGEDSAESFVVGPTENHEILAMPVLVMDTMNFTNPLFIITNLTASTSYLFKIWSTNRAQVDSLVEQVNITVRTRPNEDSYYKNSLADDRKLESVRTTAQALFQLGGNKLVLLLTLVVFICFVFVGLTLTYAIFKIRTVLEIRKARRATNVNESIGALETALCEMRPDKLENDLKTNTAANSQYPNAINNFRPYISVDTVEDVLLTQQQQHQTATSKLCSSTLDGPFADSSLLSYQNYLCPAVAHKSAAFKLNASDEESISTSNTTASTRSMFTNTTDSTNGNSQYINEISTAKHCFAPPVSLESSSNVLICMKTNVDGQQTNAGHAYLVSEPYQHQPYPLQLHILPESNDEMDRPSLSAMTMLNTPTSELNPSCAYLTSISSHTTPSVNQTTTLGTRTDCSFNEGSQNLLNETGQKSIQTIV